MSDTTLGRDVSLDLFRAGRRIRGLEVTNIDEGVDQDFMKRYLLGRRRAKNQLVVRGFSGRITLEDANPRHIELRDYLNRADLAGLGVDKFAITVTRNYSDGSTVRYRYLNVTLKLPTSNTKGQFDANEIVIEWVAEDMKTLS